MNAEGTTVETMLEDLKASGRSHASAAHTRFAASEIDKECGADGASVCSDGPADPADFVFGTPAANEDETEGHRKLPMVDLKKGESKVDLKRSVSIGGFTFHNSEMFLEETEQPTTPTTLPEVSTRRRMSKHQELMVTRQATLDMMQLSNDELVHEISEVTEQGKTDYKNDEYFAYLRRNIRSQSLSAYNQDTPTLRPSSGRQGQGTQLAPLIRASGVSKARRSKQFTLSPRIPDEKELAVMLQKVNYNALLERQAKLHDELQASHVQYCKLLRTMEHNREAGLHRLLKG
jgi:hypothetical protein